MLFKESQFDKLFDKATNQAIMEPDWNTIIKICDLIRQGDCPPRQALNKIKKKLQNQNPHSAFYALLVLESMVKNCGHLVHDEVANHSFILDLREIFVKHNHINNEKVCSKILELLQTWASAFRSNSKYSVIQETVTAMKADGIKFPAIKESDAMFSADIAPEWVDSNVCHRCRTEFSLTVRKHHCRACGNVFCSSCSSKMAPLPRFGIEKDVRVCEPCYELHNKPRAASTRVKHDVDSLPVEYLKSSLAQQTQVPKTKKTEDELKEDEDMQLALALSQSEAEAREREKKRITSEIMSNTISKSKTAVVTNNDEEDEDPELARYLNRSYWEKKQTEEKAVTSEKKLLSPDRFRISPGGPPSAPTTPTHQLENGEVSESELNEFVSFLKSQVEIFVNRMKSNSSRGRSISNDSSVQTLFMNVTKNHSTLLNYIHQQDDSRVYYEGLQDKLAQVKDAMMALDALREEHREKLRREAEEAERLRQLQMAQKLEIMRRRKQEYLQFQRQLAIQKVQEQEREMQIRQEQQKQQYLMGSMGMSHVPWDPNIPQISNLPGQYGQQYQSLPCGYIPPPTYSMTGPSGSVAQQQSTGMPVPGNVAPGIMPGQVIPPHSGQLPVQHPEQQSPRVPPQPITQQQVQPRLMGPPTNQERQLPNSNQMSQMQIPSTSYQGIPMQIGNQMLPQSRSLVMGPPPSGPPTSLPGNINLPVAGAPPNLNVPPIPSQVVNIKPRLPQNVSMPPIPGQNVPLPPGVVLPQQVTLSQGSQQRLSQGLGLPSGNMGIIPAGTGPVNGQQNMIPQSGPQVMSSQSISQGQPQTQVQPSQQAPVEQSESKTEELISFD